MEVRVPIWLCTKMQDGDVLPAGECDIVPGLVSVYQLIIQIIGQRIVMNL